MLVNVKDFDIKVKINKVRSIKVYCTQEERKELISLVGDAGYILFEYYKGISGNRNFEITDKKAGYCLGWDISKVKRTRLKLIKANYFFQSTAKYGHGKRVLTTYLGKELVEPELMIKNRVKEITPEYEMEKIDD